MPQTCPDFHLNLRKCCTNYGRTMTVLYELFQNSWGNWKIVMDERNFLLFEFEIDFEGYPTLQQLLNRYSVANLVIVKHCWGLESLDIGFEVLNCPQIVTFPRRCDGFSIQPHGCELLIRQVLLSKKGPSKSVWVSDVDQTRYIFSR